MRMLRSELDCCHFGVAAKQLTIQKRKMSIATAAIHGDDFNSASPTCTNQCPSTGLPRQELTVFLQCRWVKFTEAPVYVGVACNSSGEKVAHYHLESTDGSALYTFHLMKSICAHTFPTLCGIWCLNVHEALSLLFAIISLCSWFARYMQNESGEKPFDPLSLIYYSTIVIDFRQHYFPALSWDSCVIQAISFDLCLDQWNATPPPLG